MRHVHLAVLLIIAVASTNEAHAQQVMKWVTKPKASSNFKTAIYLEANVDLNKVSAKEVNVSIWINGGKAPNHEYTKQLDGKGNFGGDFGDLTDDNPNDLEWAVEVLVVDTNDSSKKYKLGGASKASSK